MFERGLYVHGGFADRMARLRACVEDLVASDLSTLTGGELADAVIELHSLANVLESAQLAVLERFDASGVASADGARSTAAWVRWRCRTTHAYARSRVDLAREVRDLPNVSTALADGQISTAHVRAIAGGRDAAVRGLRLGTAEEAQVQQAFSEAEPTFATAARELDPVALR